MNFHEVENFYPAVPRSCSCYPEDPFVLHDPSLRRPGDGGNSRVATIEREAFRRMVGRKKLQSRKKGTRGMLGDDHRSTQATATGPLSSLRSVESNGHTYRDVIS